MRRRHAHGGVEQRRRCWIQGHPRRVARCAGRHRVFDAILDRPMSSIRIRPYEPADQDFFVELIRAEHHEPDQSDAEAITRARHLFACVLPGGAALYVAFLVIRDNEPAGHVMLIRRKEAPAPELNYVVARPHRGRGVATEAARLLCKQALAEPGCVELMATVHPDNRASQRVLEKIGFSYLRSSTDERGPFMEYRLVNPHGRRP